MGTSAAVLLVSAAVLACDITGWPSTTHRPVAPRAVAAAEIVVAYAWTAAPSDAEVAAVRAAAAATLSQPGLIVTRTPAGLALHLAGAVPDWALVDGAVRSVGTAAQRGAVRAVIARPDPPASLLDEVRRLAPAARLTVGPEAVTLEFPAAAPPAAALLWRLRRLLAP